MNRRIRRLLAALLFALAGLSACAPVDGVQFNRIRIDLPETEAAEPAVELLSCKLMEETSFIKIIGKIRNIDGRPVSYAVARGAFRDASGLLLAVESALVQPPVLAPGAEAGFMIVTPARRAIRSVSVRLDFPEGADVPMRLHEDVRSEKHGG